MPTRYKVLEIKFKMPPKVQASHLIAEKISPIKIKQKLINGKFKKQNINIYITTNLHVQMIILRQFLYSPNRWDVFSVLSMESTNKIFSLKLIIKN